MEKQSEKNAKKCIYHPRFLIDMGSYITNSQDNIYSKDESYPYTLMVILKFTLLSYSLITVLSPLYSRGRVGGGGTFLHLHFT
jgi:hypothetical protein